MKTALHSVCLVFLVHCFLGSTIALATPGPQGVVDICFADTLHGWILANESGNRSLFRTKDGGQSWSTLGVHEDFMQIYFIDPQTGWATAAEWPNTGADMPRTILYGTKDGGYSWSRQAVVAEADSATIPFFRFVDRKHGWFIGQRPGGVGLLLQTNDGGSTLIENNPLPKDELWTRLYSDGQSRLWLFGNDIAVASVDGGKTWFVQMDPSHLVQGRSSILINAGIMFKDGTGWAAGSGPDIIGTRDAGKTWHVVFEGQSGYFADLSFGTELQGCAVTGNTQVFCTWDGGRTWNESHPPLRSGIQKSAPWEIAAIPARVLFSAADRVWLLSHDRTLFRSEDAGRNWEKVSILGKSADIHDR